MSDTETIDALDGPSAELIDLQWELEEYEIGVLVTVTVTASGDQPVFVRIVDEFPESTSILDARFAPEHQPAQGSIDGSGATFEMSVPAGESVTTKYGVRLADVGEAPTFRRPVVDTVRPVDRSIIDDTLSGDVPPAQASADDAPGEGWHEGNGQTPDPDVALSPFESESPQRQCSDDGGQAGEGIQGESVVGQFIEEIEGRELTDRERDAIRSGLGLEQPQSVEVQLRHLQSEVSQFDAFASAMEAFIDGYGSPMAFAEELETHQNDLEDRVEDQLAQHREAMEHFETELASLREEIDRSVASLRERMESELESIRAEMIDQVDHRIAQSVSDLETRISEQEQAHETVETKLEWMQEDIEANAESRSQFHEFVEIVKSLDETDELTTGGRDQPEEAN